MELFPEFSEEFGENYPELWGSVKTAFEALYTTEIGKIARILGFGMMGVRIRELEVPVNRV